MLFRTARTACKKQRIYRRFLWKTERNSAPVWASCSFPQAVPSVWGMCGNSPYITGKYGGAAFVLIYFVFLLILGIPILTLELAVGRASQRSVALSMDVLEPKGTKWHWFKFPAMAGNYILMMFYTTVAGWMVYYFFKMAAGGFVGMNADKIGATFNSTPCQPDAECCVYDCRCYQLYADCGQGAAKRRGKKSRR